MGHKRCEGKDSCMISGGRSKRVGFERHPVTVMVCSFGKALEYCIRPQLVSIAENFAGWSCIRDVFNQRCVVSFGG